MARRIYSSSLLVLLLSAALSGCAQRGSGPGEVIQTSGGAAQSGHSCCAKMEEAAADADAEKSCCATEAKVAAAGDQLVGKTFRQQTERVVTTVRFEPQGVLDITTEGLSAQPAHTKGKWMLKEGVILLTLRDGQAKVEEQVKVMDDRLVGLPVQAKLPGAFASIKEAPETYTLVR